MLSTVWQGIRPEKAKKLGAPRLMGKHKNARNSKSRGEILTPCMSVSHEYYNCKKKNSDWIDVYTAISLALVIASLGHS